jgi:hypothetical protein
VAGKSGTDGGVGGAVDVGLNDELGGLLAQRAGGRRGLSRELERPGDVCAARWVERGVLCGEAADDDPQV